VGLCCFGVFGGAELLVCSLVGVGGGCWVGGFIVVVFVCCGVFCVGGLVFGLWLVRVLYVFVVRGLVFGVVLVVGLVWVVLIVFCGGEFWFVGSGWFFGVLGVVSGGLGHLCSLCLFCFCFFFYVSRCGIFGWWFVLFFVCFFLCFILVGGGGWFCVGCRLFFWWGIGSCVLLGFCFAGLFAVGVVLSAEAVAFGFFLCVVHSSIRRGLSLVFSIGVCGWLFVWCGL